MYKGPFKRTMFKFQYEIILMTPNTVHIVVVHNHLYKSQTCHNS